MKEFLKTIAFRYTKFGAPRYSYNVEPAQLAEIVTSLNTLGKLRDKLNIFEIGLARGMTTRFIVEHVRKSGLSVNFYCLDTFSSFTEADLEYETKHRGKTLGELAGFKYNDYETWKSNFAEFDFVNAIQCDASTFDFSKVEGGVDFMFLDVDLYQPTLKVLRNVKDFLNDGAIILVDDVQDGNSWDGAYQAFFEYIKEEGLEGEVIGNKCGKIVWKAAQ